MGLMDEGQLTLETCVCPGDTGQQAYSETVQHNCEKLSHHLQ